MNYTIENEKLKVEVCSRGAELMSIVMKEDGCEYLWQGNPEFWASRACNLFPICGRLWDGKYTYQGSTYEMNLHGFMRKAEMELYEQKSDSVSFRLTANEETLSQYPFNFEIIVTLSLDDTTVKTEFNVVNKGDSEMIFSVGGHPGFNVPLSDGESFNDYYLEFSDICDAKKLVFSGNCYFTGKTEPFPLQDGCIIPLHHNFFDNDAVFLTNTAKEVTLKSKKSSKSVTVSFPDMINVGFWHAPMTVAPYVCIEPWNSIPALDGIVDDFEAKLQMTRLSAGEEYVNAFTITVK